MVTNMVTAEKKTKFIDEFSKEIYEQTYEYKNEGIDNTFKRIAKNLASVEKDNTYWENEFYNCLTNFKFVTGGRILSNAGAEYMGTTYINCFVDGFTGEDRDSMNSILDALKRQAMILKSEGGYGFCADTMRPRGAYINGIGNESPGAVKMLEMWDTQSAVITSGSGNKTKNKSGKIKIRKGAQMVTMSIWMPDIEEFITAKQTPGRLTKFNMSVLITDDFMHCVKNNLPWNLEFPDYEKHKLEYKKEWDGNLSKWKKLGYDTIIYKTYDNANILWDLIMQSTYNRNEPGVLFVDTINKMNNLYYDEYISASNPCGEQMLPTGGVCLLGSINLTQFIDFNNKNWKYDELKKIIHTSVRMLDNVNDITYVPLEIQKQKLKDNRRIGLGILGYGSALMMMQIKYGSDIALKITEQLQKFIMNEAYSASALLAKEKGTFLKFNKEKYLSGKFIKNLDVDVIELINKYGIRNSHLLSHQPTGNTSIVANVVSGGQEPVFMPVYKRTTIMPYPPNGLDVPKNIDWDNKKYTSLMEWEWISEGDESLLKLIFNNQVWKYDKSRGLLRENIVKDYAVRYLESINMWDENAEYAATTTKLSIDDHINTMTIFSKYIDSAMSKTVNIPNNYSFDDFKNLYLKLYDTGTIKGATTYRAGTMTEVLGDINNVVTNNTKIQKNNAIKRPKSLVCDIHQVTADGVKWLVFVGLLENEPYEIFAFKPKSIQLSNKIKSGILTKVKKGRYDLDCGDIIIENIGENFETNEQEALTRMISTTLRHGVDIEYIVDQLVKSEGTIISFSKAIARTLKKYITEIKTGKTCNKCKSENIAIQEGCIICLDCGDSKCS